MCMQQAQMPRHGTVIVSSQGIAVQGTNVEAFLSQPGLVQTPLNGRKLDHKKLVAIGVDIATKVYGQSAERASLCLQRPATDPNVTGAVTLRNAALFFCLLFSLSLLQFLSRKLPLGPSINAHLIYLCCRIRGQLFQPSLALVVGPTVRQCQHAGTHQQPGT